MCAKTFTRMEVRVSILVDLTMKAMDLSASTIVIT